MIKRILDFIFSAILILFLSPVFILIAIMIKLTSSGPILFRQIRVGKDNKEFVIYKFRTMKVESPNVASYLLDNPDKYITSIGKFLRSSSMDELPQLFNILIGNMSFVGPRPVIPKEFELINLRTKVGVHKLKPGLTGWAQVNGRDEVRVREKVYLDEYYLKNYSLLLDIKIIFITALQVTKSEGIVEGHVQTQEVSDKR